MTRNEHEPQVCPICRGTQATALPFVHPLQAVLSDGKIHPQRLRKISCHGCGLVTHWPPISTDTIRQFYGTRYDLGAGHNTDDKVRGTRYAKVIASLVADHVIESALEVGCGVGHTLAALVTHWPAARMTGIDPAPQLVVEARAQNRIIAGFLEDLPVPAQPYDLVYAINVIEHAANPRLFLAQMIDQLAPEGSIVLICPSSASPNLELVFFDHVNTFSREAFRILAHDLGLEIVSHADPSDGLGDFQHIVLRRAPSARRCTPPLQPQIRSEPMVDHAKRRAAYMANWSQLDSLLLDRTSNAKRLALFGAGEIASLLRAYATETWRRASMLIVDNRAGGRALGLPIVEYDKFDSEHVDAVIIATHPRTQPTIATRLLRVGFRTVCFDDWVAQ